MNNEVKELCTSIAHLYLKKVQLPEEFRIQIFEWGMENYAMNERYYNIRQLYDQIATI